MKKTFSLIPALLLLLFVAAGCSKDGSGSAAAGSSDDKISLEMKFKEGDVFKIVNRADQEISMKMMGMSNDVGQKFDFYLKQEVKSVAEDGSADIEVTYDRIVYEINMALMGQKITYDSEIDEPGGANPMADAMDPVVGKSFTMKLDKRGQVLEVTGLEAILDGMAASGGEANMEAFKPENIKKTMQGIQAIYPDVLVGEGDTWGAETDLSGDYPLDLKTTYKVEKIESDKIILGVDGTVSSDGKAELPNGAGSMSMDGTQKGTMEIDRATGMMLNGDLVQDISGEVTAMGQSSPMTISSKITIETYE